MTENHSFHTYWTHSFSHLYIHGYLHMTNRINSILIRPCKLLNITLRGRVKVVCYVLPGWSIYLWVDSYFLHFWFHSLHQHQRISNMGCTPLLCMCTVWRPCHTCTCMVSNILVLVKYDLQKKKYIYIKKKWNIIIILILCSNIIIVQNRKWCYNTDMILLLFKYVDATYINVLFQNQYIRATLKWLCNIR